MKAFKICSSYLGATAIIVCFVCIFLRCCSNTFQDLTNQNSFDKLSSWILYFDQKAPQNILIFVVGKILFMYRNLQSKGCKGDLTEERQVSYEAAKVLHNYSTF
jgi:hypothetical protein